METLKAESWGRILLALGFLIIVALALPWTASSHTQDDPLCTNLVTVSEAERPITRVGSVCVWNDESDLFVHFKLSDASARLQTTKVSVAGEGESKPSSWEHQHFGVNSRQDLFSISLEGEGLLPGEATRIWAHAVFIHGEEDRAEACICPIPLKYGVQTPPTTTKDSGGGGSRRRHRDDATTTTLQAVAPISVTSSTIPVSTTVAAVKEAPASKLPFTGVSHIWLFLGLAIVFTLLGSGLILLA